MLFSNPDGNAREISNQMMIFDNQADRTSQKIANIVYLFLFCSGSIYFAFMGFWVHALVCAILAVITIAVTWIIFLLFAPDIRKQFFQRVLGRDSLFATSSSVRSQV